MWACVNCVWPTSLPVSTDFTQTSVCWHFWQLPMGLLREKYNSIKNRHLSRGQYTFFPPPCFLSCNITERKEKEKSRRTRKGKGDYKIQGSTEAFHEILSETRFICHLYHITIYLTTLDLIIVLRYRYSSSINCTTSIMRHAYQIYQFCLPYLP